MLVLVFLPCPEVRSQLVIEGDLANVIGAGASATVQPDDERILDAPVVCPRDEKAIGHAVTPFLVDPADESINSVL